MNKKVRKGTVVIPEPEGSAECRVWLAATRVSGYPSWVVWLSGCSISPISFHLPLTSSRAKFLIATDHQSSILVCAGISLNCTHFIGLNVHLLNQLLNYDKVTFWKGWWCFTGVASTIISTVINHILSYTLQHWVYNQGYLCEGVSFWGSGTSVRSWNSKSVVLLKREQHGWDSEWKEDIDNSSSVFIMSSIFYYRGSTWKR